MMLVPNNTPLINVPLHFKSCGNQNKGIIEEWVIPAIRKPKFKVRIPVKGIRNKIAHTYYWIVIDINNEDWRSEFMFIS